MAPEEGSIEEPLTALLELKRQGLIRNLGLSNVSPGQLAEAQRITEIVCVQNFYNVAQRNDDGFIQDLAAKESRMCRSSRWEALIRCNGADSTRQPLNAGHADASRAGVASSARRISCDSGHLLVAHLRENLKAAMLTIPSQIIADLDSIGAVSPAWS